MMAVLKMMRLTVNYEVFSYDKQLPIRNCIMTDVDVLLIRIKQSKLGWVPSTVAFWGWEGQIAFAEKS